MSDESWFRVGEFGGILTAASALQGFAKPASHTLARQSTLSARANTLSCRAGTLFTRSASLVQEILSSSRSLVTPPTARTIMPASATTTSSPKLSMSPLSSSDSPSSVHYSGHVAVHQNCCCYVVVVILTPARLPELVRYLKGLPLCRFARQLAPAELALEVGSASSTRELPPRSRQPARHR